MNFSFNRIHVAVLPLLALLFALLVVAGCGGSGGSDGGAGSGTLALHMADAPDSSITALNVTIPKVEANVGGQWVTIATPNQTYNLLDFAVSDTLLGQATLPAGTYTQIRLFVSSASVVDGTGTHNLIVPSGAQSGLKLNVDYTIQANTITDVLMDFNVEQSLVKQGNGQYLFKPVVPVVVKVLSGTITGTTTDGTNLLSSTAIMATYTAGSSYPIGTVVDTSASLADGTFKLWALLPGTYTLTFLYTDPVTLATKTATVTGVVVTANANTAVGSVILS